MHLIIQSFIYLESIAISIKNFQ